ncbi:OST-HTH/LOTUS domain-containing protein [Lachnospiraceae bacterium NK3A20]|nr:OST-HTH/LOTUS domain-containing protein [Lachnospiraceae bacterium NK3A20]
MEETKDINIAMLIDVDNISSKYISSILSELSKYGKITIRHMYGDWTQDRLRSWMKCSAPYSLTPVMQPNNTPGKNSSDIGLIIDAMDILYTGDVQGFCIVSSDGDFNKLATRLREAGKVVIGMGEKKTPESFRQSCERFIFLDVIQNGDADDDEAAPAKKSANKAAKSRSKSTKSSRQRKQQAPVSLSAASEPAPSYEDDAYQGSENFLGFTPAESYEEEDESETGDSEGLFTDQKTIEDAIVKMITDNNAVGKETGLGEIGSRLVKIYPDFDIRNYQYSKLSEFLKDLPSLQVSNRDNSVWISLKATSDSDLEKEILSIFRRHDTNDMNIGQLKQELQEMNPNLDATIRKSGVTRFSVYLNRNIHSVEVNGRHVTLVK